MLHRTLFIYCWIFQIYDGAAAERSLLFPDQPELLRGVWSRPSVAATKPGGALHVKFSPPTYDNGTEKVYTDHIGFKAQYWVTNSPPDHWLDKAVKG